MYPNPLDDFSNPQIGPSDLKVNKYVREINITGKISAPIEVQKLSSGGYEIVNGHHRWLASIKAGLENVSIHISGNHVDSHEIVSYENNTNTFIVRFERLINNHMQ